MISVVINTLNESARLADAISSVKKFADEIVVIDMESDDRSVEIAKDLGAKVFTHKRMDYVELARNFGISKASGDWILILDPDEQLCPSLSVKLKEEVKNNTADYFRIPRKNIVFNKWLKYSRWWPDYNIRFFKKGSVEWSEMIHSVPITTGRGADVDEREDNEIIHHHYDSISQYLERLNRYTNAQSAERVKKGEKFSWKDLLIKPSNEFLSRYFLGQGYKDGAHGLALSLLQGFSELIVFLKIWEINKFEKQNTPLSNVLTTLKNIEKDFHFWEADSMVKENGGLVYRIRRKLKM